MDPKPGTWKRPDQQAAPSAGNPAVPEARQRPARGLRRPVRARSLRPGGRGSAGAGGRWRGRAAAARDAGPTVLCPGGLRSWTPGGAGCPARPRLRRTALPDAHQKPNGTTVIWGCQPDLAGQRQTFCHVRYAQVSLRPAVCRGGGRLRPLLRSGLGIPSRLRRSSRAEPDSVPALPGPAGPAHRRPRVRRRLRPRVPTTAQPPRLGRNSLLLAGRPQGFQFGEFVGREVEVPGGSDRLGNLAVPPGQVEQLG